MRLTPLLGSISAFLILCTGFNAQADSTFPAGSSIRAFQDRKGITVGGRIDVPSVMQLDPLTGRVEGFDADIIRAIAKRIGVPDDGVKFTELPSTGREAAVNKGLVDFLIGTYVITTKRREQVSQAGPYAIAKGYLYVRKENKEKYKSLADIKGISICTTPTSTYVPVIEQAGAKLVPFEDISACTQQVVNGNVDGKTGNDLNNLGYVKLYPDLLPADIPPIREEGWGVAFKKDDKALCQFVIESLRDIEKSGEWEVLWDKHFTPLGVARQDPPTIEDRC